MNNIFDVFQGKPTKEVSHCSGLEVHFVDGEKLLDVSGGSTSAMILGWRHPLVSDAMIAQLNKFSHIDYKLWRDPNLYELADIITKNSPKELDSLYMSGNSGAEACETSLKMSFLHHQANGHKGKTNFIGRLQSYHGSTLDAMSFTDRPNLMVHKPLFPNNKILLREHNYFRHATNEETQEQYLEREIEYTEKIILEHGEENIAAFLGETISGGLVGDVPPVKGYWKAIRKLCDKYNIHLILDEVYCGTGTSGRYHCFAYDGVVPDFVMLAKTLSAGYSPLSAVLTKSSIQETIHHYFDGRLAHSTTMQAYSLGVAAAIEVQKIVSNPIFLSDVLRKSNYMMSAIQNELAGHPNFRNIRGRGLRFSVEHQSEDNVLFAQKISSGMLTKGIYIDSKWHKTGFTPALTINDKQIDFVVDSFVEAFKGNE